MNYRKRQNTGEAVSRLSNLKNRKDVLWDCYYLIILVVLLLGGLPTWGYSRSWGYGPSGVLGLLVVVAVVLLLMGYLPHSF